MFRECLSSLGVFNGRLHAFQKSARTNDVRRAKVFQAGRGVVVCKSLGKDKRIHRSANELHTIDMTSSLFRFLQCIAHYY